MKALLKNLVPALWLTVAVVANGYAADSSTETAKTPPLALSREQLMMNRLNELKAMEPEKMTAAERKAVRKEVRQIKKQMRVSNGIYISFGALIIIILLLILIF